MTARLLSIPVGDIASVRTVFPVGRRVREEFLPAAGTAACDRVMGVKHPVGIVPCKAAGVRAKTPLLSALSGANRFPAGRTKRLAGGGLQPYSAAKGFDRIFR